MKSLSSHIQYLLRKFRKITIPQVGTLEIVEIPAFINVEENFVIPPSRTIYFDGDIVEDESNILISSFQRANRCSFEEAVKCVERSIEMLTHQVSQHNVHIFGRLGQFFKKDGKIDFKPNRRSEAYNPYTLFDENDAVKYQGAETERGFSSMRYHIANAIGSLALFLGASSFI